VLSDSRPGTCRTTHETAKDADLPVSTVRNIVNKNVGLYTLGRHCTVRRVHGPSIRAVNTAREHGCHFGNTCYPRRSASRKKF